ncbi:MAG: pilus assembly protein PilP [Rhodanobacteraceae bacterium]|nr:pilus assembly protein PilP [Rhodanobacteraceae bacterium]
MRNTSTTRLIFTVLLLAASAAPVAAQPCNFNATVPANWQRIDASMASLRLPREAYVKGNGSHDADSLRYLADGLDVLVDYGIAGHQPEAESGTVSRLLGGAPALISSETQAGGAGRIAVTWVELGQARLEATVTIRYGDASRQLDACRIASSLQLHSSSTALTLVRTGRAAGQPYAVVRDAEGRQRRVVEGDYIALNWGKVTRIDQHGLQITERIPLPQGHWEERKTLLHKTD